MKKLITFLSGLVLMGLMCAALFAAGAIFDTAEKLTIEPYFFQPDDLSSRRMGVPASPADLGENAMRELLIRRYVTEFFYVIPVEENIAQRMEKDSAMATMSSAAVFDSWLTNVAPQLQSMAADGKLRLVKFSNDPNDTGIIKRPGSDYWEVEYSLHTWDTPNNLSAAPQVTRGTILLKVIEADGIRESIQEYGVHKYLDEGKDPATLFKFAVTEVAGL